MTALLKRSALPLSRHWLLYVNLAFALLVGLPWLAPILMEVGATGAAEAIYTLYRPLCHQLADRSFFLFGSKATYSYTELVPHLSGANVWLGLKDFVGNAQLGYKVAWSDRMVSLYGGFFVGGLLFALARRRLRPPSWALLLVLMLPMIVDGTTHAISDLAGMGEGFRYTNGWLATLTGNALPQSFYAGTELGSFNSWMRLVTGTLFGLGAAWMAHPALESFFADVRSALESQLRPS